MSSLNSVIAALRVNMSMDSAQLIKGANAAGQKLKSFSRGVQVAMAGVATAGTAAFTAFNNSANRLNDLKAQANAAGVTAERMQVLGLAAQQFGVTQEQLSDQLKDVNDKFGDFAQTGAGPLADFFENIAPKVGVTLDSFKNLSSDEALSLYVTSLEKANLSQQEMTFYMEAIASDSTMLIQMFGKNGMAIDEMTAKAKEYGLTVDEGLIKSSKDAQTELSVMGAVLRSVFDQAVISAGPALAESFKAMMPAIKEIVKGIGGFAEKIAEAAVWFSKLNPTIQQFAGGLLAGTVLLGPFIAGFGFLAAGIGPVISLLGSVALGIKAISVAMLANPIGLAVAAIAGAAYLIYDNWDDVGPWFSQLWADVQQYFTAFKDFVVAIFSGDLNGAVDGIKAMWEGLQSFYSTLWDGIVGVFTWAWENGIKPVTDALGMTDEILVGWERLKTGFSTVLTAISGAFTTMWDKIKPVIDGLKWIYDNASSLISKVNSASDAATPDGNNRAGNGPIGFNAKGTNGWRGGLTWVGEEGPELLDLRAGARIHSNPDSMAMAGSSDSGFGSGLDMAKQTLAGIKQGLDINSPSKEMEKIGQYAVQGLSIGLEGDGMIADSASTLGETIQSEIGQTLKDLATGTKSFKDAFNDMLMNIANSLINSGIDTLMDSIFGGMGGIGGAFAFMGNILGGNNVVGSDALSGALRAIPGFAKGTNGSPSGLALVGEQGPELMNLRSGTQIFNSKETEGLMSGGGHTTIDVNLSPDLIASVKEDNRRTSINTTRQGISEFQERQLPGAMRAINKDSGRR